MESSGITQPQMISDCFKYIHKYIKNSFARVAMLFNNKKSSKSKRIRLTVVDLDFVKSSKYAKNVQYYATSEGANLLYEQIEESVFSALNSFPKKIHKTINSLGGDGYRISFEHPKNAYKFVRKFANQVNKSNSDFENNQTKRRTFRISAVTGSFFYNKDKSNLGLDVIRSNLLITLNGLLTGAAPGWFYIDQETYSELSRDEQKRFSQTKLIKRKPGEKRYEDVWGCKVIKNISTPKKEDLQSFKFEVVTCDCLGENPITGIYDALYFVESSDDEQQVGDAQLEIEMVKIPEGSFQRRSPNMTPHNCENESPHIVKVPSFFLGKYPITQAQWRFVAQLPLVDCELNPKPSCFGRKDNLPLPVEQVSWHEAIEFCKRLSKYEDRNKTRIYRLPTETEWEYACRARTTTKFHFGDTITTSLANYYEANTGVDPNYKTTVVGSFEANAFGLYDMHGNVWEWCQDDWHDNYDRIPKVGSGYIVENNNNDDSYKVLRGGAYNAELEKCSCASRKKIKANFNDSCIGFRIACDVKKLDTPMP